MIFVASSRSVAASICCRSRLGCKRLDLQAAVLRVALRSVFRQQCLLWCRRSRGKSLLSNSFWNLKWLCCFHRSLLDLRYPKNLGRKELFGRFVFHKIMLGSNIASLIFLWINTTNHYARLAVAILHHPLCTALEDSWTVIHHGRLCLFAHRLLDHLEFFKWLFFNEWVVYFFCWKSLNSRSSHVELANVTCFIDLANQSFI